MSQHLYFNIGQESRPVIEKLTKQNVKESLFSEQYKNAFDSLSSYLKGKSPLARMAVPI